jgi:hypothetical protein
LLWIVTIASQFASPAESAIVPQVVEPTRIAGANSFANLCEAGGQLLGMAILAPIFVKLTGSAAPLIAVCGLIFLVAAVRALAIRTRVAPEAVERAERAAPYRVRGWPARGVAGGGVVLPGEQPARLHHGAAAGAGKHGQSVLVTLAPRFPRRCCTCLRVRRLVWPGGDRCWRLALVRGSHRVRQRVSCWRGSC